MCSDRNACSKNLIEARDEMTEMKRKLKIMSHQINQLKDEIASKVNDRACSGHIINHFVNFRKVHLSRATWSSHMLNEKRRHSVLN